MIGDSITKAKKLSRYWAGLCINCGQKPCRCKVGKWMRIAWEGRSKTEVLPVGITRRGGQRPQSGS